MFTCPRLPVGCTFFSEEASQLSTEAVRQHSQRPKESDIFMRSRTRACSVTVFQPSQRQHRTSCLPRPGPVSPRAGLQGSVRSAVGAAVRGAGGGGAQLSLDPHSPELHRGSVSCRTGPGGVPAKLPEQPPCKPPSSLTDIKYVWSDCCLPSTGTGGQ